MFATLSGPEGLEGLVADLPDKQRRRILRAYAEWTVGFQERQRVSHQAASRGREGGGGAAAGPNACVSVCLSVCLSVSLSLSIYLSIYLSISLSLSFSLSLSLSLSLNLGEGGDVRPHDGDCVA